MKTAEEILNQHQTNGEYPSYYHESNVLEAMEEYARQCCDNLRERIVEKAEVLITTDYDGNIASCGVDINSIRNVEIILK